MIRGLPQRLSIKEYAGSARDAGDMTEATEHAHMVNEVEKNPEKSLRSME